MKKMKDRKMNPMRRTLVGVLTVVMLFGICFSGVQIPAFADELYQNTIEQEFDQAVTLLCMQYRTFAGSEADRELLDMELESLQIQIEKAENISDAARKDLMERLSEYAPEKKEDTPKTSFYGSGPLRTTGSTSVETKSLSFTKTVDKKSADNDLYDLTLTLSGAMGTESNKTPLDVVIIIDKSNSMKGDRITEAKSAANALIDGIQKNKNISASYNILSFNGSSANYGTAGGHTVAKSVKASGWVSASSAKSTIDAITVSDYTNYDAAFRKLNNVLSGRTATSVVVFLTDGNPTITTTGFTYKEYTDEIKKGTNGEEPRNYDLHNNADANFWEISTSEINYGTGVDDGATSGTQRDRANVRLCLQKAIAQLKNISMDRFYAVGFGSVAPANIQKLVESAVKATYKEATTTTTNNLTNAFNNIAMDITTFLCDQVTLTDTLKHQTEAKLATDLMVHIPDTSTVKLSVWKTNGTKVAGPSASVTLNKTDINAKTTLTATYNATTHQLKLNFPPAYKLEPDYIYKLHAVIEPTETAYETYRDTMISGVEQGYPDQGEAGTGTHASNNGNSDISTTYGFQSNDSAVVTYNYKEVQSKQAYAHPVVQLKPGKLIVTKAVVTEEALTADQLAEMEANTKFDIHLDFPPKVGVAENASVTMDRTIALSDSAVTTPDDYLDKVAFAKADTFPVEADGKYTYNYTLEIPYLSPDTVCTVEEKGASLTNFDVASSMKVDNVDQQGLEAEVTIPRGGTKNVAYSNVYRPSTTKLIVEKTVSGNMGDRNLGFNYTASLKDKNGKAVSMNGITYKKYVISTGAEIDGESGTIATATFSFTLKHDQKIVFDLVPMNTTVTVDEAVEGTKYDAYINGSETISANGVYEGKIPQSKEGLTVSYENVYEENIDTGVLTDSVPMVVLLSVSLAAAFLLIRRRRFN